MEFKDLAKKRYSCRKFSDKKVEKELLDQIVEAGMLAPTAVNKQPYKIFMLMSDQAKENIAKTTRFIFDADCFLVVGYKNEDAWVRKYDNHNFAEVDASIVATHMMMEITDLGLATTWVGHFDAPLLKQLQPEMKDYELIAIFPIGYEADDAKPAHLHFERKTKEEICTIL